LTVLGNCAVFIEVEVLDENVCIADFNQYCSGKIKENVKSAGY